jgi:hypothetical protein
MSKFSDNTATYCRDCTNAYYRWRYRQNLKGLPAPMNEFRKVHTAYLETTTLWEDPQTFRLTDLKECPICFGIHRNPHSIYCPPCKACYEAWARGQRDTYALSDGRVGRARPTVEEFRCMVFDLR